MYQRNCRDRIHKPRVNVLCTPALSNKFQLHAVDFNFSNTHACSVILFDYSENGKVCDTQICTNNKCVLCEILFSWKKRTTELVYLKSVVADKVYLCAHDHRKLQFKISLIYITLLVRVTSMSHSPMVNH